MFLNGYVHPWQCTMGYGEAQVPNLWVAYVRLVVYPMCTGAGCGRGTAVGIWVTSYVYAHGKM